MEDAISGSKWFSTEVQQTQVNQPIWVKKGRKRERKRETPIKGGRRAEIDFEMKRETESERQRRREGQTRV